MAAAPSVLLCRFAVVLAASAAAAAGAGIAAGLSGSLLFALCFLAAVPTCGCSPLPVLLRLLLALPAAGSWS